jgi:hypothetical protein
MNLRNLQSCVEQKHVCVQEYLFSSVSKYIELFVFIVV